MSADSIDTFAIEFPDPASTSLENVDTLRLDQDVAFDLPPTAMGPIVTLSSTGVPNSAVIEGMLYVPLLPSSDPCNATAQPFIPRNVTSVGDIPEGTGLPFFAIAPWVSATCTLSYLNYVQNQGETEGLLMYLGSNVNQSSFAKANPPDAEDSAWDISADADWPSHYSFPVYAINSDNGNLIVQTLAKYSGNITKAPNGAQLAQTYGAGSYVRLYTSINTGESSTLPSLWVFLLIVLGLLLGMIVLTSVCMHMMQRRRRTELRRMVALGQVDLEMLGIKRLKVPRDLLEKQPLFVYYAEEEEAATATATTDTPSADRDAAPSPDRNAEPSPASSIEIAKDAAGSSAAPAAVEEEQSNLPPLSTLPRAKLEFAQPSCPICLDDFEPLRSIIRQLPCKHVFHPACIDPVLTEYSSLCPICKAKVLPAGYTPEITNAMVRRVRGMRDIRRIQAAERGDPIAGHVLEEIGLSAPYRRHRARRSERRQTQGQQGTAAGVLGRGSPPNGRQWWRRGGSTSTPDVEMNAVPEATEPAAAAVTTDAAAGAAPAPAAPAPAADPAVAPARARTRTRRSVVQGGGEARPPDMSREEWARRRAQDLFETPVTVDQANRQQEAQRPRWRRVIGTVFPVVA